MTILYVQRVRVSELQRPKIGLQSASRCQQSSFLFAFLYAVCMSHKDNFDEFDEFTLAAYTLQIFEQRFLRGCVVSHSILRLIHDTCSFSIFFLITVK
jgi:hypothetical protein